MVPLGIVLLSVLMGNSREIVVQQATTSIGILSPLIMSLVWLVTSSGAAFRYGCLISVIASFCNVLFNKLAHELLMRGYNVWHLTRLLNV